MIEINRMPDICGIVALFHGMRDDFRIDDPVFFSGSILRSDPEGASLGPWAGHYILSGPIL